MRHSLRQLRGLILFGLFTLSLGVGLESISYAGDKTNIDISSYNSEQKTLATLVYITTHVQRKSLSDDSDVKSAVKELGSLKYQESVNALLDRLMGEVMAFRIVNVGSEESMAYSNAQTQYEIIVQILLSLRKLVNADQILELADIEKKFVEKTKTLIHPEQAKWVGDILYDFSLAIQAAEENTSQLPSIGLSQTEIVAIGKSELGIDKKTAKTNSSQANQSESEPTAGALMAYAAPPEELDFVSLLQYLHGQDSSEEMKAAIQAIAQVSPTNFTDTYREEKAEGRMQKVIGRDKEADQAIDILARIKGGHLALTGPSFSGKTTLIWKIVEKIAEQEYPQTPAHMETFDNGFIFGTSVLNFNKGNPAKTLTDYFSAIGYLKKQHGINIITAIDDIDILPPPFAKHLADIFLIPDGPQVILEADSNVLKKAFESSPRAQAVLTELLVRHLSRHEIEEHIHISIQPVYEQKYGVKLDKKTVQTIVDRAPKIYPKMGPVEGAKRVMQDFMIHQVRHGKVGRTLTEDDFNKYREDISLRYDNPLEDKDLMNRLNTLADYLNHRLKGWEESIEAIVDAIYAQLTLPAKDRKAPLSIMLVGSTGIGKSELAKAIGYHLFYDETAALVLEMGTVTNKEDKNKLFGAPPGYIGYGTETELELFIANHEETGGVILWDEISNMGGSSPAVKEELFKLLYAFVEEGKWTPPHRNTPYDLSRFVFIFTGNDGEHLFQGISADELRISIWLENNKKERIIQMLRERGIPEAFLGRMADLILAKPLTTEVMKEISMKFFDPILASYQQKGVQIEFEAGLLEQMAVSFFSQSTGARSVRNIVERRVRSYLTQLLHRAQTKGIPEKELSIKISLEDNLPSEPFVDDISYKRKVTFTFDVQHKGQTVDSMIKDVTGFAPVKQKLSRKKAAETSYHEAGHAATTIPEIVGVKVESITINPADHYLGYSLSGPVSEDVVLSNPTKTSIMYRMASLLAGQRAQQLKGFEPNTGWSSDISKVRKLAYDYFVNNGDSDESDFLSVPVDKEGFPVIVGPLMDKLLEKIDSFIREADKLCISLLTKNWNFVEGIAEHLLRNGSVSEKEYLEIKARTDQDPTQWEIGAEGRMVKKGSDRLLDRAYARVFGKPRKDLPAVSIKSIPRTTPDELADTAIAQAFANIDILGEKEKTIVERPESEGCDEAVLGE